MTNRCPNCGTAYQVNKHVCDDEQDQNFITSVKLKTKIIKTESEKKDLGIIIDNEFKFQDHINTKKTQILDFNEMITVD